MGAIIKGVWRPTDADKPYYIRPKNWKNKVPASWWSAYQYLRAHGIPTDVSVMPTGPPPGSPMTPQKQQTIHARVYFFAMWASLSGSKFRWRDELGDKTVKLFNFDGGISIVDVRRMSEDFGTSVAPRLSELVKSKMLYQVDHRPDPITGNMTKVYKPSSRTVPLPKLPSFKKAATAAIVEIEQLLLELDEDDEWTQRALAAIKSPELEYLLHGKINGQKVK